jgi:hypothetical protein
MSAPSTLLKPPCGMSLSHTNKLGVEHCDIFLLGKHQIVAVVIVECAEYRFINKLSYRVLAEYTVQGVLSGTLVNSHA